MVVHGHVEWIVVPRPKRTRDDLAKACKGGSPTRAPFAKLTASHRFLTYGPCYSLRTNGVCATLSDRRHARWSGVFVGEVVVICKLPGLHRKLCKLSLSRIWMEEFASGSRFVLEWVYGSAVAWRCLLL